MLTREENERLTRVGPGTPMGELLRRYWMPIMPSAELGRKAVSRRLLGEDLVVFRDGEGKVGVVERHCPHRRADMSIAVVEQSGIRCGYHGWRFDHAGACVEQPAELRLNPRMRIGAYPAEELGGLVWVYMGPQPAPLLPRFDMFVWDNVLRDIGQARLDFNWLQAMENSVDPYHVEWLHAHFMNWWRRLDGSEQVEILAKKHLKVGFDAFDYGIIKRRVLVGQTEDDDDWKIGHPLVLPIMLRVGGGGVDQFQIRVPVDDTTTWHVWYTTYRPEGAELPRQPVVPSYEVPLKDGSGNWILDFADGQDIAAWAGQGPIADRTKENLGVSDKGVVLLRQMLKEQLERLAAGQDPLGTVRDPAINRIIELPMEHNKYGDPRAFVRQLLTSQAIRYSPLQPSLYRLFGFGDAAAVRDW